MELGAGAEPCALALAEKRKKRLNQGSAERAKVPRDAIEEVLNMFEWRFYTGCVRRAISRARYSKVLMRGRKPWNVVREAERPGPRRGPSAV